MTYGVTPEGFNKKTYEDIKAEIQADQRDLLPNGQELNLLDTSVFGVINGIFGDKLREQWDVGQLNYRAMYPDSASDEALDQVAAVCPGIKRLDDDESTVTLDRLYLDNGTTVPIGSIVSVGLNGNKFVTTAAVTNATGYKGTFSAEAEATETGALTGFSGSIDTIDTPISGWSDKAAETCVEAESYAVTTSGTLIILINENTDEESTETVTFPSTTSLTAAQASTEINGDTDGLTATDQNGYVRIESDRSGEGSSIQVTGGTLTAVFGFSGDLIKGFNSGDADVGQELEEDAPFRQRREELLFAGGSATVDAITAKLRLVTNVKSAFVLENTKGVVSADGLPPHSFESVVEDGLEADIVQRIWDVKPAGIEPYGQLSAYATDINGAQQLVGYSRPTYVPIYMELTLTVDPLLYPTNGDDLVEQALATYGDSLGLGQDIIALAFKAVPLDVLGVIDVPTFYIDTAPITGTPYANIEITFRQRATFDTDDIEVV